MKLPFVVTAVFSLVISFAVLNFGMTAFGILIGVFAALVIVSLFYFRKKARRNTNIFIVIPICLALLLGSVFIMLKFNYGAKAHLADTTATMTATVISEPSNHGDYNSYVFKGRHPATGQYLKFSAIAEFGDIDIGDSLEMTVAFSKQESAFRNNWLSNGVFLEAKVSEIHSLKEDADPVYTFFGKLRYYIKSVIYGSQSGDPAAVMTALATGDRDHISDSLYADTKTTGVTHFLVVSGLHLSIISSAILLASNKLRIKKRIAVFVAFAAICLLTIICDFHSSAIRSAFMSLITLSATLTRRKAVSLNSLGFAVTVMTVLNPFIVGNAAFLLSVSAAFGVIYLSPAMLYLTERLFFKERPRKFVWNIISVFTVSMSALIAVFPISVHYYGYLSLLSPIVTVLIASAIETVLIITLAAVAISPVPLLRAATIPLIFIAAAISKYAIYIVSIFARAQFLVLIVDSSYANICFLLSATTILIIRYIYNKKLKERKDEDASIGKKSEKLA